MAGHARNTDTAAGAWWVISLCPGRGTDFTGSAGLVLVGVGDRVGVVRPVGIVSVWCNSLTQSCSIFCTAGGVEPPACARGGVGGCPSVIQRDFNDRH